MKPKSSSEPSLYRSARILGVATAASRVLGFFRDWLIAIFYGTGLTAQAFVVAWRIPNLFRTLVGEGAANSAFVPVFSRIRTLEGDEQWRQLSRSVWTHLLIGVLLLSAAGVIAASWAVRIVAPGFTQDPELFDLTVRLTRILFPFVGLIGIASFFMGVLNSVRHFTLPALGPILLNLCMIVGMFLWRPDALGLSFGILVGGLLQLVIQWPVLRKFGISLRLSFARHPGVAEIRRTLVPRMVGTAVFQGSVLVDTIFASFSHWVGAGGVAALYFAHRFLHLPLGIFGVSVAQAALPTLSAQVAVNDWESVRQTVSVALRSSLLIAIPSSVGLIVLGYPIIHLLLEHGAFTAEATAMTVPALQCYAVGLGSLCAVKVLVNTLYAYQDTWTPVRSAAVALVLNILLNFLLIGPLGLAGLALATTISSSWNAAHLFLAVRRRLGPLSDRLGGWLLRVLLASLGEGILVYFVWRWGEVWVVPQGTAAGLVWLLVTIAVGIAGFFLLALLFRIAEASQVVRWLFRRS